MSILVLPIQNYEAAPWIMEKHYAKRLPSVSFAFGAYRQGELIGVVTYGVPASPFLCMGVCGTSWRDKVLELNRLCCESTKNVASTLVGRSLKMLPKPSIVVSYADTAQGHVGYIYQATNWNYTGATKERTDMFAGDGKHSRHNKGDSSQRQVRSSKHRYVFFVGSATERRAMRKALMYPIEPYPKGESRRYDASAQVQTQGILFQT